MQQPQQPPLPPTGSVVGGATTGATPASPTGSARTLEGATRPSWLWPAGEGEDAKIWNCYKRVIKLLAIHWFKRSILWLAVFTKLVINN